MGGKRPGGKRLGGKRHGGQKVGGQKVGGQKTGGQKTGGQKTGGQKSCHRSESVETTRRVRAALEEHRLTFPMSAWSGFLKIKVTEQSSIKFK